MVKVRVRLLYNQSEGPAAHVACPATPCYSDVAVGKMLSEKNRSEHYKSIKI